MQDLHHQPYYDPLPPYTQNLINTKPLNPPSFALPLAEKLIEGRSWLGDPYIGLVGFFFVEALAG